MADTHQTVPQAQESTELIPSSLDFPVVGIGASAGGVAALLRFFEAMPSNSGMAFVVVLHLSPTHESSAADILQRATRMMVSQVSGPTPIEANHIYVIPPTHELSMNDGYLQLLKPERRRGPQVAIDHFFRDLAEVHRERAIAIVLSGTGADGSVGLARLKEEGGITLAQSPEEAEYDGMPRAAIATGMVDFVLGVAEMPERLMSIWANASRISLPKDAKPGMKVKAPKEKAALQIADDALQEIMVLLRNASKNDFRSYKRATVLRRIERRLQVRALPDLPAYRDYLRSHPEEVEPLLQDMLISVTNFFRDREAFEALERNVLPVMLRDRVPNDSVRVWVAGCATGEEAYSVSMLLHEQMVASALVPDYQVFATDIDENAIGFARTALYPASIVADVTPGRLQQFFSIVHDQYHIAPLIREKVLFAIHNVLRDPPFSRLDLICCRNLLIYLSREAQILVLEMFRFALKPGGYLFLGTSESADATPNLFTVVDKKNRIYRTNPHAYALRHLPAPLKATPPGDRIVVPQFPVRRDAPSRSFADIHLRYVGVMAAPSVLIDDRHNVLHLSENVGKFLVRSGGTPSLNLLANVQPELRIDLRTALFQAQQTGQVVETRGLEVPRDGGKAFVKVTVKTFRETPEAPALTLVMFQEVSGLALPDGANGPKDPAQELIVNQLESEIRQLKTHLRETIEQSETSTEELKASNEELQAINEELRSATEELETAKEELQSINEELTTVNFELKTKVDEAGKVTDDLQNMIVSADIATIFVDRGLRVKRFTPQAAKIFNLIASDIDRPLLDITHRLDYALLSQDVQEIFRSLGLTERQVQSNTGETYIARIRPYRTMDDRIGGAVLTFVDVTALRRAEDEANSSEKRLRVIAETTPDYAIFTVDEAGLISTWNVGAQRMFGYSQSEVIGRPYDMLFTPEDCNAGAAEAELKRAREVGRSEDERWHQRKDGSIFYCSGIVTPMDSGLKGFAKIARDITETKKMQASRDELLAHELAANQLKDQFLAVMSHELKHPLNLIQVNTELLISQPEVRALPNVSRFGETIRLAIESQAKIIDDLLDLSRARTGKLTLSMDAVNLKTVAASIVAAAADAAQEKGVSLSFQCDLAKVVSLCDRVRAEQIFWNLINNAIKFTPATGTVTVSLGTDGAFAKLTVSDTGRGIESEFLPSVFDMFIQAPGQSTIADTGLGVGLALVRDMAAALGGRVLAESQGLDKGATFSVWLPLDPRFNSTEDSTIPPAAGSLNKLRILVVDDTPDSLEPFAALLRLEGATADIADGGEMALAKLDARPYDLIISDLGMTGMDGFQFIREVRKRPQFKSLRAIALSGYGRKVDVERALRSGFDGHLSKPATVRQVSEAVAGLGPVHPIYGSANVVKTAPIH